MKRKTIPKRLKDKLLVLCKHACMICRLPYAISHHIEPISEGGGNEWMNLIVLCPNCHHRVHVTKEIRESQLRIYRQEAEEGKLKEPSKRSNVIPFPPKPLKNNYNQKAENITNIVADHISGINITNKGTNKGKTSIKIPLPADSIGADSFILKAIADRIKKLADYRIKRLGKENPSKDPKEISDSVYATIFKKFKIYFSITKQPYTIYKTWHKNTAQEIIGYFDSLIDKTIQGKIEKAAKRPDYKHSRKHLLKQETQILKYFGLSTNSPEVYNKLYELFRVHSHKDLTDHQHWQWVKYLESRLEELKINPDVEF